VKYYSIHEFSKLICRTPQTLRTWDKNGRLKPDHLGPNGYRYYSDAQLREVLGKANRLSKRTIGYCRVSSGKQKDDLERQVEKVTAYLLSQGNPFEIVTDIGSGINYNKKGLRELIARITTNEVSKVVVLYKDRLLRFGFEFVEYVAELYGCAIEVIDSTEKTEEQELVEDLVQIITVFSCKLNDKRASKARKIIKELIADDQVV